MNDEAMAMRRLLALCLGLLIAAVGAATDPYQIVPGQGFGEFRPGMSLAQIEKRLKPGELGEGETDGKPSADIYFMEPGKRVGLRLDAKKRIRSMFIHGDQSVWHTREGITLGTTLVALEKLNGKPFRFRGLGMGTKAGEVIDWGQGKLARSLVKVRIVFASGMHAKGYSTLNDAEHSAVESDRLFSSADPVARKLNPVVETIELEF